MEICCIIKPEAAHRAADIRSKIAERGIAVRESMDIIYTDELIAGLYDHMSEQARRDIAFRLSGKKGIALVLDAADTETVLEIAGRESDPRRCAPGSLRAEFGLYTESDPVGAEEWWQNAIHRPVDEREARRDMRLIFGR